MAHLAHIAFVVRDYDEALAFHIGKHGACPSKKPSRMLDNCWISSDPSWSMHQHPAPPPPPPPDRAHWTPARQRIFLVALVETGCVARAARAAGMSRSSAHRLRARLAGTPFVRAWDGALAEHARRLADPFAATAAPAAPPRPRPAPGGVAPAPRA